MKTFGIVALILAGCLGVFIGCLFAYGASLPRDHTASVSMEYEMSRAALWSIITDYPAMPAWWKDVKSVELETRPDGSIVSWNVDSHGQRVGFITTEEIKEKKLVRQILDEGLPFGGTWTFELSDAGPGKTRLGVTENGFVRPAFFRAVAKIFIGYDGTLKNFHSALARRVKK